MAFAAIQGMQTMKRDTPVRYMPSDWIDSALKQINLSFFDDRKFQRDVFEYALSVAGCIESPLDHSEPDSDALLFSVNGDGIREGESVHFAACFTRCGWELREMYGGLYSSGTPAKFISPEAGLACRIIENGGFFHRLMKQRVPVNAPLDLHKDVTVWAEPDNEGDHSSKIHLTLNNGLDGVFTQIQITHNDGDVQVKIVIGADDADQKATALHAHIFEQSPLYKEGVYLFDRVFPNVVNAKSLELLNEKGKGAQ